MLLSLLVDRDETLLPDTKRLLELLAIEGTQEFTASGPN